MFAPSLVEQCRHEARFIVRGLRRSPAFTLSVVTMLALGIGANTAMLDLVDRLMFRPLAYLRDPGTVHRIYWQRQQRGAIVTSLTVPYTRYLDLQRSTTSFSQVAAFSERPLAVGEGESARERRVGLVSASFFDLFDAKPAVGRFFSANEDATPRGADVAVISHEFWRASFNERTDVLGTPIQVGEVRATIVGVAPRGFNGVNDASPPAVYLPITTFAGSSGSGDAAAYFTRYSWGWVQVLVRRKPGVSIEQAQADATAMFRRSWDAARIDEPAQPSSDEATPVAVVSSVRPGGGPDPALDARVAVWLAAVAAIVLLIACGNVANLLLTRAVARRREISVRLALGASRARLVAHTIAEALMLSFAGGVAALGVSAWASAALRGLVLAAAPDAVLPESRFIDSRVIVATLAISIATGLLTAIVPARLARRQSVSRDLRGGIRGGTSEGVRLRGGLLVVQASLSVVLLIGALLFVRSLRAAESLPLGYDAEHVLLVSRTVRGAAIDEARQRSTRQILESTARSIASIESFAWVNSTPFLSTSSSTVYVDARENGGAFPAITFEATTPDYFRTMGTRLLRGRGLSEDDRAGAPGVAVVSQTMARQMWPGEDPIGQCFRVREKSAPCTRVVGIAEDIVQRDLVGTERSHFYLPINQYTRSSGNWMMVRVRGNAAQQAEAVRTALQRAMPGASYVTVYPLSTVVHDAQRPWRLGAAVFAALGGLALVVASIGLYSVVGYNVAQRAHDLAVRIALGAGRRDIIGLILRQSVLLALAGVVVGGSAALLAGRWIQPVLFHQSARDPRAYLLVAALMVTVAIAASLLPALRASRLDPNRALRSE